MSNSDDWRPTPEQVGDLAHCGWFGDYTGVDPMPLKGRVRDIDQCIARIVAALNAAGIETSASCCGHGATPGSIMLSDGRELLVLAPEQLPARAIEILTKAGYR